MLSPGGYSENISRTSLSPSTAVSAEFAFYTPPTGTFRDGYSPTYISISAEASVPHAQPLRPGVVSKYDDCIRCFTASPDLLDSSRYPTGASSQSRQRHAQSDNAPSPPLFPLWPVSSRMPSYASFTTDSGRTLSSRSSRSSLLEPHCDPVDSHPVIVDQESIAHLEWDECTACRTDTWSCSNFDKDTVANSQDPWQQPRIVMPIPTSWSQLSLH